MLYENKAHRMFHTGLIIYKVVIIAVKIQTEKREQHTPKHDDRDLVKYQIPPVQRHAAVPAVEIACCESAGKMLQRANQQSTRCHGKLFRQRDFNNPECFTIYCHTSK